MSIFSGKIYSLVDNFVNNLELNFAKSGLFINIYSISFVVNN